MNYKNESEKYGIAMRDLAFPFIKGSLTRPQRTGKVVVLEIILEGPRRMLKLSQHPELCLSSCVLLLQDTRHWVIYNKRSLPLRILGPGELRSKVLMDLQLVRATFYSRCEALMLNLVGGERL